MTPLVLLKPARFIWLFALALASVSLPASAQNSLKPEDHVAICGDSITEQKLYSLYIEDYLLMCQPEPKLKTTQFGWSGEVAGGFLARMKNDMLPFKPTVATTCYGMNDGGYAVLTPEREKTYRNAMTDIVKTLKEGGVRFIVVGTPGAVDTDTYTRNGGAAIYNKTLSELGAVAREVAEKNGTAFADVHSVMVDTMAKAKAKYGNTYHVGGKDGVHPSPNGHIIMAYAFLKALGCSGDIGTITLDAKAGTATATDGHKVLSADPSKISVESSKYPFCFSGSPEDPASTAGIIEFLPFNQDLNRFQLVVKNAAAPKMKVTWGTESKEFTSEQLAQGINLAAEFLKNPFVEPFQKIEKIFAAQQAYETTAHKFLLHSFIDWRKNFTIDESVFTSLTEKILKKETELQTQSTAAIKPVQHTITVEAVN